MCTYRGRLRNSVVGFILLVVLVYRLTGVGYSEYLEHAHCAAGGVLVLNSCHVVQELGFAPWSHDTAPGMSLPAIQVARLEGQISACGCRIR